MTANDLDLALSTALDGCPAETVDLFAVLFTAEPPLRTARAVAARVKTRSSTLVSRFRRAGVPSVKVYLVDALLVRAAFLLDDPAVSVATVARRLGCSSAQAFGRMVHTYRGVTAGAWRRDGGSGQHELSRYVAERIRPFLVQIRTAPLAGRRPVSARRAA